MNAKGEASFVYGRVSLFTVQLDRLGAVPRVGEKIVIKGDRRRRATYKVEDVIYTYEDHGDGLWSADLAGVRICVSREPSVF
jgi:hypothetical protein